MARKNRQRIKPIDLSKTVEKLLSEYGDEVYKHVGKAVQDVTEEATQKLQSANHFAPGGHPTGAYAKDWTHEETLGNATSRLSKTETIYNEGHYQLAHLLEHGHALKRGGRTYGSVKAYPHIKPVEEWATNELEDRVRREIEGIS